MKNIFHLIGQFGVQFSISVAFFTIYYVMFVVGLSTEFGQSEFYTNYIGHDSEKMMILAIPTFVVSLLTLIIGVTCLFRKTISDKYFQYYLIGANFFCSAMVVIHVYIFTNSVYYNPCGSPC